MQVTNNTNQDYWFGPLHIGANATNVTVDDTSATSLYLTDDGVADAINTLVAAGKLTVTGAAAPFPRPTGTPEVLHGDGSPEGLVYAGQGSIYLRRDNGTLYSKTTGIHLNTGWSQVGSAPTVAPTGSVTHFAGTTPPTGWLRCDGSAVSRTTYSDLFAVIGTTYGSGDGSTTFNLPDTRGRVIAGYAASGGHTDVATMGANDGVAAANRRPKHRHTAHNHGGATGNDSPDHSHAQQTSNGAGGNFTTSTNNSGNAAQQNVGSTGGASTRHTHTISSADGGSGVSTDSLDAPAYIVFDYIIKT